MPRGYEPEEFIGLREVSEDRESATEQSSQEEIAREQAADDRSPVATQNHIETQLLPLSEERFRSLVKRPLESDVSGEILRYFQVRRKWERHEYVVPIADDQEFLRDARRRFHGDRFESLYQGWSKGTITERELRLEFSQLRHDR